MGEDITFKFSHVLWGQSTSEMFLLIDNYTQHNQLPIDEENDGLTVRTKDCCLTLYE